MRVFSTLAFIILPHFVFSQVQIKNAISLKKHQVVCVSYSSDGKYLVTGGLDSKIVIWDYETSSVRKELTGLKEFPLSLVVTPDDKYIVSGGKDKKVTIWNFQSGLLIQSLKGHSADVTSVSVSHDNTLVASASKDKSIIIWDLNGGQQLLVLKGHEKEVTSVAFNSSGSKLVSGSADGTIKEWDSKTGNLIRTIEAHTGWVRCVSYSPNDNYIASGGDDFKINIWNGLTGDLQNSILAHSNWVQTLAFSPDGKYLASGGHDNYLILIDVKSGRVVFNSEKRENFVLAVAFNPNGADLVSSSLFSDKLTVWDIKSLNIEGAKAKTTIIAEKVKPDFKWISQNNTRTEELTYKINFSVKSAADLDNIELYLNNKKFESFSLKSTKNKWQNFQKTLFLGQGSNDIKIIIYDEAGVVTSDILTIAYEQPKVTIAENKDTEVQQALPVINTTSDAKSKSVLGELAFSNSTNPFRYALVIGNEDYSSYQVGLANEVNVDFAINDATTFKEYANKVFGVPEDNIIFLANARAIEMDNAILKIQNIIKALNGKAEIIIYYAGHGFPDESTKEPYLIPVDVTGTNLKFAIKLKDLYKNLTAFPSAKITVFLDACFSGGARNMGLVAARGVKVKPKEDVLSGNLVVLSASSANQSSLAYKEKQHGMFTYFLLQKLKESKGDITYTALSEYVVEQVGVKSALVNNKEQTPQVIVSPSIQNKWQTWRIK